VGRTTGFIRLTIDVRTSSSKLSLMRACPYCAEQIPDETVICPYCKSDVRVPPGSAEPSPEAPRATTIPPDPSEQPEIGEGALRFSHSGSRYLLGFGTNYFGIWDRQAPGGPLARFPKTDEGWRQAWLGFFQLEPRPAEVGLPSGPRPVVSPVLPAPRVHAPDRVESEHVSPAWWLLPILFGTIGGIVAWALTRGRDRRTARNMLVTGVALSAFFLIVYVALGSE
jgi:hypothetical protein